MSAFKSKYQGKPIVEVLKEGGVLPGTKVDKGTVELAGTDGETTTQGLDGLAQRCQKYHETVAMFAKWCVVPKIGPTEPSKLASFNPFSDSQNINKPPYFNGSNYSYWKNRMKFFIISLDVNLWDIVEQGFTEPAKPRSEWSKHDKKLCSLNAKAINCLFCALNEVEYNRVSICTTAKEIWDKLEITHEGTQQVKEIKIDLLVHQYELFKIDDNESISDMYIRFTNIINSLEGLGKKYPNIEKVKKILWALPQQWEPKVTAIQEAKDLKTLSIDELIGSLMTHEIKLIKGSVTDKKEKKDKSLALKTLTLQDSTSSEDEEVDDEDVAYLARKYKRFIRNKKFFKKNLVKKDNNMKDDIIYYNCKKPGHKV